MPHTQPGNQYIQIEDMWVQDTHPIDPLGFTNRTVILDRPNDITTNAPSTESEKKRKFNKTFDREVSLCYAEPLRIPFIFIYFSFNSPSTPPLVRNQI